MPLNVLQILAITSTSFVLFAILWVTKIEKYLEDREVKEQNNRTGQLESETRS